MMIVEIPIRTITEEIKLVETLLKEGRITLDYAKGVIAALRWVGVGAPLKEKEGIIH